MPNENTSGGLVTQNQQLQMPGPLPGKGSQPRLPRRSMRNLLRAVRAMQRFDISQEQRRLRGMASFEPLISDSSSPQNAQFRAVFNFVANVLGSTEMFDRGMIV